MLIKRSFNHFFFSVMRKKSFLRYAQASFHKCSNLYDSDIDVPSNSLVFNYSSQDFSKLSKKGVFYVDKTSFIRKLENAGDTLVFLRPRRFGKSVIVSMLEYYYDILYKDRFQELFGHLDIGKNPTPEANSYLVFRISFASLNMSSIEKFDSSFAESVNDAVIKFKNKYENHPDFAAFASKIKISNIDTISSFRSMANAVSISKFRNKLYVLIDEYDTAVNDALKETKKSLYEYLYHTANEAENEKAISESETKQSLYKRFFSAIKEQQAEGGVGRVYITGINLIALNDFTSGFNNAKHLTFLPHYADMCGFKEQDLRKGLAAVAPLVNTSIDDLLPIMKQNYNGYLFHTEQAEHVYNPTLSVYFMDRIVETNKIPEENELIDRNVHPSESTLQILARMPLTQTLMDTLLTRGIYTESPINQTLDTRNMLQLIHDNPSLILAFMYYIGAVTQSKLPEKIKSGTQFVIPNQIIKSEYFDAIQVRLNLSKDDISSFHVAITDLIKNKNIAPLCELIKERVLVYLKSNDVVHAYEQDIKVLVLGIVNISGRKGACLDSEFQIKQKTNADLVLIPTGDIHIECKNLTTEEVVLPDGTKYQKLHADGGKRIPYEQLKQNWEAGVTIAKRIDTLSESEVRALKLREASKYFKKFDAQSAGNYSGKPMVTVQDAWDNLIIQTTRNNQLLEKHFNKPVKSFALMRVGLYTLLYSSI